MYSVLYYRENTCNNVGWEGGQSYLKLAIKLPLLIPASAIYMYIVCDLLLRWLAHLVLYCTDEAQLSRNSCLQLYIVLLAPFFSFLYNCTQVLVSCGAYSVLSHAIQGFVQEGDEVCLCIVNLPPLDLKTRHLNW
jgi:hypothetical protein